jgi:hypothetical protein
MLSGHRTGSPSTVWHPAGNLFAESPTRLVLGDICLPSGTAMHIGTDKVVLRNRVLQIAFALEAAGVRGDHLQPQGNQPQQMQVPKLGDGRFRYHTLAYVIQTTFFGLHAYDTAKPTYEA